MRVSDELKSCGVKIVASIGGVPSIGSGVVYITPNLYDYDYVLTARHVLQEDSLTPTTVDKILNIEILCSTKDGKFERLEYINKKRILDKVIFFDEDFAIIIVKKNDNFSFRQIIVADALDPEDENFFAWAIFSANQNEVNKFDFVYNDAAMKRFKSTSKLSCSSLPGMSGAGIFVHDKNILHGIICKYPNDNFENETIDCSSISFASINRILKSKGRVELDTELSRHKREINKEIVDIHQAFINGVCLNLELARKRLKTDIADDWYHDPLHYIDLLDQDFLFKQFEENFNSNTYSSKRAEQFYVPKKKLTLRQAQLLPFKDRIIYLATVGVLAEILDSSMIPNVYSARYNRFSSNKLIISGVEQWKKLQYKLDECSNLKDSEGLYTYGCVIEVDLLNFYDNISKKLLIEKIRRVCQTNNEIQAANLLENILTRFSSTELGLPQNSDASSLLASFYLNQIDVFMHLNAPNYFRFMDDIKIFCKTKYEARKILQTLEFELRRCGLSVNSQKTEILELVEKETDTKNGKKVRNRKLFDLEINKISRLRKSNNYAYMNDAFHISIDLLKTTITSTDPHGSDDQGRRINYALNTLVYLGIKRINFLNQESDLIEVLQTAVIELKDRPWITTQVCRVLNLLSTEVVLENYGNSLKEIVLDSRFNTYSYQTYQIWLLLAKHKMNCKNLKQYAVKQIERNDQTNRAVIAAMIIYLCSVDKNYKRVTLRKVGENFTHGYFQIRLALISLRSFDPSFLSNTQLQDSTLEKAHEFTHKFKEKDLVFVQGINEGEVNPEDLLFEQLYSI